jgi:predicted RNA methylase
VKNPSHILYRELRRLPWKELWEVRRPRFDKAGEAARRGDAALVRAIGVVLCESSPTAARPAALVWLRSLLDDPEEKIRRYAMGALVKNRAASADDILPRLHASTSPSEKKALTASLEKIAPASLEPTAPLPPATRQKLAAATARATSSSRILLDAPLPSSPSLRIHLRCRRGLENHLLEEITALPHLRLLGQHPGLVAVRPAKKTTTLRDILAHRIFATLGIVLGTASRQEEIATLIASHESRRILSTLTQGPVRYRLEFIDRGHQRAAIRSIATRAYSLDPSLINDPRSAIWAIDLHDLPGRRVGVELRPRLTPDPRFPHRLHEVPASSHPPLAAAIARLAHTSPDATVWDPFCGAGLELIECARLGAAGRLIGSDISPAATEATRANLHAANLPIEATIIAADFRAVPKRLRLAPASLDAIITNPPLGRRVPVPQLENLLADLFHLASVHLRTGGSLVLANPAPRIPPPRNLRQTLSHPVDMGGFTCHLQRFEKK